MENEVENELRDKLQEQLHQDILDDLNIVLLWQKLEFLLEIIDDAVFQAAEQILEKYSLTAEDLVEPTQPTESDEEAYLAWYERHEDWKLYINEILQIVLTKIKEDLEIGA